FWGQPVLRKGKDLTQSAQRKAEVTEKDGEIPAAEGPAVGRGAGVPSQKILRASGMTMLAAGSDAQRKPGSLAASAGERALDRRLVVCDIFTDSSSASGERNPKGCVCTCSRPSAAQYSRSASPQFETRPGKFRCAI